MNTRKLAFLLTLVIIPLVSAKYLPRADQKATVDEIIVGGSKVADTATKVLTSPILLKAAKVNAFANALPNAFAAGGAALGSAIALPIQLISSAASGAASGVTGFIISVPIAIKTSLQATNGKDLFIRVKPQGDITPPIVSDDAVTPAVPIPESVTTPMSYDYEEYEEPTVGGHAATKFILKPIAILVGAKSAISGAGSYVIGKGLEKIGGTFTSIGHSLAFTGNEVRGAGATLFNWGSGHTLPLLSSDDDLIAAVNVTKQLPEPVKEVVMDAFYKKKK